MSKKEDIHKVLAKGDYLNAHFYRNLEAHSLTQKDKEGEEISTWHGSSLNAVKKHDIVPLASHINKLYGIKDHSNPTVFWEQTGYAIGTGYSAIGRFQLISYKNKFYSTITIRQKPVTYIYCSTDVGMKDFWDTNPHENHFQDQVEHDNADLASLDPAKPHNHRNFEGATEALFKHRPDLIGRLPLAEQEDTFMVEVGDVADVQELTTRVWKNKELIDYMKDHMIGELKKHDREKSNDSP